MLPDKHHGQHHSVQAMHPKPRIPALKGLDVKPSEMRIADPYVSRVADEEVILADLLPLRGAKVLELGCGKADKTRLVAQTAASVLALEVDATQLAINRASDKPDNVRFEFGGAENIPAEDSRFDIVLMFKSLHHVPTELMDDAFSEIRRVLKPGGVAYISEPVYAGDFNDILRMFHDEKAVREAAFAAEVKAVSTQRLSLLNQTFFLQPMHFEDFGQFESRILKVTHTDHQLSPALYDAVRARFNQYLSPSGAGFHMPMRVDLFRKDGS
ncbi:MAG: class I SAM-dependent methyltransferase [Hyphomicrobiaceae bacterium]